jgi:hypothetical protein
VGAPSASWFALRVGKCVLPSQEAGPEITWFGAAAIFAEMSCKWHDLSEYQVKCAQPSEFAQRIWQWSGEAVCETTSFCMSRGS